MVYPALLPLMRTPRLPVVDQTDAPADLNGLVRFAERRNLVSARAITAQLASTQRDRHAVFALVDLPSSLIDVSRSAPTIGLNLTTHRCLQCHIPVFFLILYLPNFQDVSPSDITCW